MSYCSNSSALCGLYEDMFIQLLFITTSSWNITILHPAATLNRHSSSYVTTLRIPFQMWPAHFTAVSGGPCPGRDRVLGGAVHMVAALELPGDKESLGVDAGRFGDKQQWREARGRTVCSYKAIKPERKVVKKKVRFSLKRRSVHCRWVSSTSHINVSLLLPR